MILIFSFINKNDATNESIYPSFFYPKREKGETIYIASPICSSILIQKN